MLMHSFKIIHGDIKPENIMWSLKYMKPVFIDFGLSKCIKEDVGEKTLTTFFGTFGYCYEEMRKLFEESKIGFIDLYFNDVHCLK